MDRSENEEVACLGDLLSTVMLFLAYRTDILHLLASAFKLHQCTYFIFGQRFVVNAQFV